MENMNNLNNMQSNINNVENKNNKSRKKNIYGFLATTMLIVAVVIVGCIVYYIDATDRKDLKTILPIGGESYSFDSTKVTEGNIEPVKDVSTVVEKVMPSVVAITETSITENYYNFYGFYQEGEEVSGYGSGIIVGEDDNNYYIVTNNHVIDGADKIEITFVDNEIVEANVKGVDPDNDLAVVSVEKKKIKDKTKQKIKIAKMGNSSDLRVGEVAIAIGNSLGYGQSATVGYIGALNRQLELETGTMEAIQTDAAINPGNSGGALLNDAGEVIGINSAKLAAQEVEGMGYAIPISKAKPILDKLISKKTVNAEDKGYLGIAGRTVVQEEIEVLSYKKGVYVEEVYEDGGAKAAGIIKGDIITKVNDESAETIEGLISILDSYKKGEKIKVVIWRNSEGKFKKKVIEVTLASRDVISETPAPNINEYN